MPLFTTLKFIVEHPINKGRKGQALFDFLKWQIGSGLVPAVSDAIAVKVRPLDQVLASAPGFRIGSREI